MNKYMISVTDEPIKIEEPLREHGLSIYYIDRYRNDIFGVEGNLSIEEVKAIPFVLAVSKA